MRNPDAFGGPLVPPEWMPPLERPARTRPASPWAVASAVAAFLAVGAVVVSLAWLWYARSVVAISVVGVEGFTRRDLAALSEVIPAQTARSPQFLAAMRLSQSDTAIRFGETKWGLASATIEASTPIGPAKVTVTPATDYLGAADVVWSGPPYGEVGGRVVLIAEAQSWRVLGIQLGSEATSFAPEDVNRVFGSPSSKQGDTSGGLSDTRG